MSPTVEILIRMGITLALLFTSSLVLIWGERRLLARFQHRVGPNRVGPFGLLQGVADAEVGVESLSSRAVSTNATLQPSTAPINTG